MDDEDEVTVVFVPVERISTESRKEDSKTMFTILDGAYRVWNDPFRNLVRWAFQHYNDRCVGIPTHGAAPSVRGAVRACLRNKALWDGLDGGGK